MQFITDFLLRLVNLAEAEGRLIRANVIRVAVSLVCLGVAGAVFVLAIVAGGAAIVVGLCTVMPTGWALAVVALMFALIGIALTAWARRDLRDS